jgi:hypothetical protein
MIPVCSSHRRKSKSPENYYTSTFFLGTTNAYYFISFLFLPENTAGEAPTVRVFLLLLEKKGKTVQTLFLSCSTEGPNYEQLISAGEHINTEQKHWSGNMIRLKHREDIVNPEQS